MTALRPTYYALPLIGWKEDVSLPQMGSGTLVAKIDTGARSAALHAEQIHVIGRRVTFAVQLGGKQKTFHAPLSGEKRIKSSNGASEQRPVIKLEIQVGLHRFIADVTLTNRTDMGVPMLLGREAINGRFLVHPGKRFMLRRQRVLK
jgi:hypothetical protein